MKVYDPTEGIEVGYDIESVPTGVEVVVVASAVAGVVLRA